MLRKSLTENQYDFYVSKVTKKYASKIVVDVSDLGVCKGSINIFLGENGSGKSTLFKCLLGVVTADDISCTQDFSSKKMRSISGALLQGSEVCYPKLSPAVNALQYSLLKTGVSNTDRFYDIIEEIGFSGDLNANYQELSSGNKMKVSLAVLFCVNPRYLFLDEPTLGLDELSVSKLIIILQRLADTGATILMTSHDYAFTKEFKGATHLISAGKLLKKSSDFFNFSSSDLTRG